MRWATARRAYEIAPKPEWTRLIAPIVAIAAFVTLTRFSNQTPLGYAPVVLATLAYFWVIWIKTAYFQATRDFKIGRGQTNAIIAITLIFGLFFTTLQLSHEDGFYPKQFGAIGPIGIGLMLVVFSKDHATQDDRMIWRWWRLKSRRSKAAAAMTVGTWRVLHGLVLLGVGFWATDLIWILTLTIGGIVRERLADLTTCWVLLELKRAETQSSD